MHFSQTVQLSLALAGAAMAKDIVVQVSDKSGALMYSPNTINADMGDTVTFVFNPKNHTVTESSFAAPCVPLAGGKGFNSGFMPTAADAATQGTFTYTVADKDPHWFYCEQAKHCEMGMTGVINPPAAKPENNADSFAALAKKVNATVVDPTVQGGNISSIKAGADGSATGSASASHTTWTNVWTYTSNGQTYTKATTEDIAGFTTAAVTSHWTYTSGGSAIATQTVIAATVPVAAPTDASSASSTGSSSGSIHNAGNKLAGAGVAAAAGAAAAALLL